MSTATFPGTRPVDTESVSTADRLRLRSLVRGRTTDPAWVRPSLAGLLVATAVLYIWGLGASGWANTFYSAAVQAGTHSWKAFFYGSSDASNFITVDKPPLSLWAMELSARIFGVNAWSILLPQALEGVASVGLLYATIRRWFTPAAGLLAGAVLALTPAAALMFRFNNPDAMLVLLMTAGAYFMTRSIEDGKTRWLLLAFSMVGLGFLAKMLQSLLVLPAFGLVYLIAGPPALGKRIWQLTLAMVALVVSAGWWVAIVELTPASMRPYVGGSQNNSILNLIFGYNGFGRLTGNETGSVGGGGGGGTGMWGATGWSRLFGSDFGGQIAWLLPAALLFLVVGLIYSARTPRTNLTRAALVLWGGWLTVTALVFSYGKGIIHPYYSVALGPAIGALIGIGATMLWQRRSSGVARSVLAASVALTTTWAYVLLRRTPTWHPELRSFVLFGGIAVAAAIVLVGHSRGKIAAGLAAAALVVSLSGSAAYTVATASTAHTGAIPSVGPSGAGGFGGGPGGPGGARMGAGGFGGTPPPGMIGGTTGTTGTPGMARGGAGGIGGLLNSSTPTAAVIEALQANSSDYEWVAATVGSNQAAGYQLASDLPVMALGGFNGTDPTPTLAEFQALVNEGRVHYYIAGGGGGGGGGRGGGSTQVSDVTAWVTSHFTATTVGGVTLYDLTAPTS